MLKHTFLLQQIHAPEEDSPIEVEGVSVKNDLAELLTSENVIVPVPAELLLQALNGGNIETMTEDGPVKVQLTARRQSEVVEVLLSLSVCLKLYKVCLSISLMLCSNSFYLVFRQSPLQKFYVSESFYEYSLLLLCKSMPHIISVSTVLNVMFSTQGMCTLQQTLSCKHSCYFILMEASYSSLSFCTLVHMYIYMYIFSNRFYCFSF